MNLSPHTAGNSAINYLVHAGIMKYKGERAVFCLGTPAEALRALEGEVAKDEQ